MKTSNGTLQYDSASLDYYQMEEVRKRILQLCVNAVSCTIHRRMDTEECSYRFNELAEAIVEYQALAVKAGRVTLVHADGMR